MTLKPVAVVLVMEDRAGVQLMLGSQQLYSAKVELLAELRAEHYAGATDYVGRRADFSLNVRGFAEHLRTSSTIPYVPQLPSGIYLPNMSYWALPDEDTDR